MNDTLPGATSPKNTVEHASTPHMSTHATTSQTSRRQSLSRQSLSDERVAHKRVAHKRVADGRRGPARVWWATLLLVPCLFGGMMLFLDSYGQRDQASGARNGASAIVVLGAAVNAGGVPGVNLRARTLHGIALYKRGVAPFLIFTGGVGTFAPAESQAAALLARRHGVPSGAILLEETSTSTWENIGQAARICRARGWTRVIVVSDPYHLWRARRNFKSVGIEAWPSPCANPPPLARFRMAAREVLSVTRDFLANR